MRSNSPDMYITLDIHHPKELISVRLLGWKDLEEQGVEPEDIILGALWMLRVT